MSVESCVESYGIVKNKIIRKILRRDKSFSFSSVDYIKNKDALISENKVLGNLFDFSWLKSASFPKLESVNDKKTLVDLFCGTGPMTLGVIEGGRALGIEINPVLAIDFEKSATLNYSNNFPNCNVLTGDICQLIDGEIGSSKTEAEAKTLNSIDKIDILIGGPPCQGHSDLNNHTRRNDPKNDLIFKVIRFAELTNPEIIIIENVQGIKHDKNGALSRAKELLIGMGYHLQEQLLLASQYGVPQNRRRFFLIASKKNLTFELEGYKRESPTTVRWACEDLMKVNDGDTFNTPANHSVTNKSRIDYLFEHDLYELPNHQRPKCHQDGKHSYNSVYGRMYFDQPAPTITGGFGSIGQGRFCHPKEKRSLTPHEAARVQFIPDFF